MSNLLREGERLDDLQRSNLQIIQNPAKFCFGMDAVLLSGFVTVKKGENVLDLGTGTGIIPILLSAKTQGSHFTGLEIQEEMAEMMRLMAAYGLEPKRIRMVHPYVESEANMVLLEASRGGNPWMKAEPPVIVFEKPGVYTREIRKVYGY